MIQGELAIGKFSKEGRICRVPHQGKEYYFRNGARSEVLTFPGGVFYPGSSYRLFNPLANISMEEVLGMGVPAGYRASQAGALGRGKKQKNLLTTSYIAFGMLASPFHNELEDVIGKVWVEKSNNKFGAAHFPLGLKEVTEKRYYRILVCY